MRLEVGWGEIWQLFCRFVYFSQKHVSVSASHMATRAKEHFTELSFLWFFSKVMPEASEGFPTSAEYIPNKEIWETKCRVLCMTTPAFLILPANETSVMNQITIPDQEIRNAGVGRSFPLPETVIVAWTTVLNWTSSHELCFMFCDLLLRTIRYYLYPYTPCSHVNRF